MAVPIRLRTELARTGEPVSGSVTVRLSPQSSTGPLDPEVFQLPIPAEEVIDLPSGTWQVTTEAQDLWSAPAWIAPTLGQAEQIVTLRLLPASFQGVRFDAGNHLWWRR